MVAARLVFQRVDPDPAQRRHRAPYSGINILLLWGKMDDGGYSDARFLTFKQAKELGGSVRKYEKGTEIVYMRFIERDDANAPDKVKRIPMLRSFWVFNVAQCDLPEGAFDKPLNDRRPVKRNERDATIDEFLAATGARFRHGQPRAFYTTGGDFVNMPAFDAFDWATRITGSPSTNSVIGPARRIGSIAPSASASAIALTPPRSRRRADQRVHLRRIWHRQRRPGRRLHRHLDQVSHRARSRDRRRRVRRLEGRRVHARQGDRRRRTANRSLKTPAHARRQVGGHERALLLDNRRKPKC